MDKRDQLERFEQVVLPHLDAAHNLARWLMHGDTDAEDVVQEAFIRALKFFEGFRGGDAKAWLLTIVRRTCYTWMQHHRLDEHTTPFDEDDEEHWAVACDADNPETLLQERIDQRSLRQAMEALPVEFREVMVLRELEGLSYKEIASIVDVPVGTVMSRLARARKRLQNELIDHMHKEGSQ